MSQIPETSGGSGFKSIDRDGNGTLSRNETRNGTGAVDWDDAAFAEVDKDGNGEISEKEYRAFMEQLSPPPLKN